MLGFMFRGFAVENEICTHTNSAETVCFDNADSTKVLIKPTDFYFTMLVIEECIALNIINTNENKGWSDYEIMAMATWNVSKGHLRFVLDMAGMATVIGEVADLVNGAWYLAEGDKLNASLSFAAMIPIVGMASTGAKYLVKVVKFADGSVAFLKMSRKASGFIHFGSPNQLGRILRTEGTTLQAHHIVPWALQENPVIQKAAEVGFHMNDVVNGIALEKYSKLLEEGLHANHPAYSKYVEKQIIDFQKTQGINNITPEMAKEFLEGYLIPSLRKDIDIAVEKGQTLNVYFSTLK